MNLRRVRFFYWVVKDLLIRYKRFLLAGFLAGFVLALLVGRLAPLYFASVFHPVEYIGIVGDFTPSVVPHSILNHISIGLTRISDTGEPVAALADSWTVEEDGKAFVFALGDHTWHNGKKVVARDINYNIQGVSFEIKDDKTLIAHLPEPYSPFPTLVSKPIVGAGLVGVGEYKVERIRLNGESLAFVSLSPNTNPSLPKKAYRFYQTEHQAILAYKRGDIDRIEDVSSGNILDGWNQTVIEEHTNHNRIVALFLNVANPLLKERSMRQALAFATPDVTEEAAYSPISKVSWAYNDQVRKYAYDPKQAEKLIAELKLPEDFAGFTITTFSQYVEYANSIAEEWKRLGIPTKVQVQNSVDNSFEILLSAQDLPPDPDQYPFWHSQQTDTNITGYVNLKIDKLLEDGRKEFDQEKRKKMYADFQRYLVEDIPAVFLYYPKSYSIVRKKI